MPAHDDNEIASLRGRLNELESERSTLTARLEGLQFKAGAGSSLNSASVALNGESRAAEKIALFRRLFAGRTDVYPLRWENRKTGKSGYAPACANEWVGGVCGKPQVKCGDCPNQAFLVVSDQVIAKHLRGVNADKSDGAGFVAGVYPILMDGSCRFVAADFDGEHWSADALAYLETCRLKSVPAALERSRSGEGGHVWIFFSQPIPARHARRSVDQSWGLNRMTVCSPVKTRCRRVVLEISSHCRFSGAHVTTATASSWIIIFTPIATNGHFLPALAA